MMTRVKATPRSITDIQKPLDVEQADALQKIVAFEEDPTRRKRIGIVTAPTGVGKSFFVIHGLLPDWLKRGVHVVLSLQPDDANRTQVYRDLLPYDGRMLQHNDGTRRYVNVYDNMDRAFDVMAATNGEWSDARNMIVIVTTHQTLAASQRCDRFIELSRDAKVRVPFDEGHAQGMGTPGANETLLNFGYAMLDYRGTFMKNVRKIVDEIPDAVAVGYTATPTASQRGAEKGAKYYTLVAEMKPNNNRLPVVQHPMFQKLPRAFAAATTMIDAHSHETARLQQQMEILLRAEGRTAMASLWNTLMRHPVYAIYCARERGRGTKLSTAKKSIPQWLAKGINVIVWTCKETTLHHQVRIGARHKRHTRQTSLSKDAFEARIRNPERPTIVLMVENGKMGMNWPNLSRVCVCRLPGQDEIVNIDSQRWGRNRRTWCGLEHSVFRDTYLNALDAHDRAIVEELYIHLETKGGIMPDTPQHRKLFRSAPRRITETPQIPDTWTQFELKALLNKPPTLEALETKWQEELSTRETKDHQANKHGRNHDYRQYAQGRCTVPGCSEHDTMTNWESYKKDANAMAVKEGYPLASEYELYRAFKGSYQIDHIDGNRNNNDPSNLQELCPRHHSMKGCLAKDWQSSTPVMRRENYRRGSSSLQQTLF